MVAFTVTDTYSETVTYTATDTTDNITVTQTSGVTFTPCVWTVNTLSDDVNLGTLRYAIVNAPPGSTITFQSGLTGKTIILQSQLPAINKDLTIDGSGTRVTISGNNQYRVFEVNGGTVSIKGLIIADGKMIGSNGPDGGHASGGSVNGGGLLITSGTVTIDDVTFNNNRASGGKGSKGDPGDGYGNGYCGGDGCGGAVYLTNGSLSISNSIFTGNSGTGGNGGNGQASGDSANGGRGKGGAIFVNNGSLSISNSTFTGNSVTGGNGGEGYSYYGHYSNGGDGQGGAIFINSGSLTITNSQFDGNSVTGGNHGTIWGSSGGSNGSAIGKDIYNQNGTVTLKNVTFDSVNNSCYNLPSIFTVTFDSQGGSTVPSKITSPGFTISAPTEPTRLYYAFKGWYKEPSCINAWNFGTDTVTGDITLYAKWIQSVVFPPSFTIPAGSYNTPQAVKINCDTIGATIYYTINGENPNQYSTRYDGTQILIANSATLKAIACAAGLNNSPITSHTYTINGTDIGYQPGNNDPPTSPNKLLTAQNYEGDLGVQFNSATLWLGKGKTGRPSDIWLFYPQLFGTGSNQIRTDAKIVSAQLVLTVKSFKGNPYLAHKINLYQITDPDSKGSPYFGASGLRNGLDYQYRDHRLGRNIPWKNPVVAGGKDTTIGDLLNGSDPVDTYEFIPAVFTAEHYTQIRLDVTASINSWLDGNPKQGWFLRGDQTDKWSIDDGVEFYGVTDATVANRPKLVVTYLNTNIDNNPPGAIGNFNATPGIGQVGLSWDNPSDSDFGGVIVRRKAGAIPADPNDGTLVSDGKPSPFTDTGLEDGQIYYYAAFAYDNLRNYSKRSCVQAIPGDYNSLPSTPGDLKCTLSGRNVILSWNDKSTNESEFRIYRDLTSTIPISTVTSNQTTYTDLEVAPGNYTYKVLAHNAVGDSSYITLNVVVPNLPDAPTGLKWNIISSSEVQLSWNNDTTVTYRVEIIDENGNVCKEYPTSSNLNGSAYLYPVMRLTANIGYRFRVVAINAANGENAAETDVVKTAPDPKPNFF